ncbi:MAG: undecaprenyl-diphosphatase, partial [Chloroflexi bacterium]
GATIYDLWENRAGLTNGDLGLLLVGAVVSGIVAWLAIRWLLRYVSSNDFVPFGWYRILAGVFVFILILLGVFA